MFFTYFGCWQNRGDGMGWKYIYAKGVPIEAQYLYKKAMDMFRSGKTESALKYLKQTMVIAPCYSKALFEMGTVLFTSVPAILEFYQMSHKNRCQEIKLITDERWIWNNESIKKS